MALCELRFFSDALQKQTAVNLILPDQSVDPPYSTLYLLHGLSDDHTMWLRRTNIDRYAQGLPLIIAMPDGGRSFYTDDPNGMGWERSITDDLISYIDRLFPTRAERAGRSVAGLSMGGYGAVKLALKRPDRFCAAVSHSGAVGFAGREYAPDNTWYNEWKSIFGEKPAGGPDDCFALAKSLPRQDRPALRLDCGVDDFLLSENRSFHSHLNDLDYDHEYVEHPGDHNWTYWNRHVLDTLQFVTTRMGITGFDPSAHLETVST